MKSGWGGVWVLHPAKIALFYSFVHFCLALLACALEVRENGNGQGNIKRLGFYLAK